MQDFFMCEIHMEENYKYGFHASSFGIMRAHSRSPLKIDCLEEVHILL